MSDLSPKASSTAPQPIVIQRGITAEVYFTLGESRQPQNLIDGLLYASPLPSEEHEDMVLQLANAIDGHAKRHGGKVFVNPDCWLGDSTVVQPDVAYLAPERVRVAGRYLREAPDLVVEVVEPRTLAFDNEAKFEVYGKHGVREAWFVHLAERTVTVVSGDGSKWLSETHVGFGEPLASVVLPGIGPFELT